MKSDDALRRGCRWYRAVLVLYPANHRREYGPWMLQLFRDQCRDAQRHDGAAGLRAVWRRTLADAAVTALRERLTNQCNDMKTMTPSKLSFLLLAIASALLIIAALMAQAPLVKAILLLASSLALLARAAVEWFRAPTEWVRAVTWALVVAVVYAFICPAVAQLHTNQSSGFLPFQFLTVTGLLLNVGVPILKAVMALVGRRARQP